MPPRPIFYAFFSLLLSCCFVSNHTNSTPTLPEIIAHRGGTADAPENTLAAIELAIKNKADMIWLSVQLSKDDIPVLYRPADLGALTNGSGTVADHSLAELQNFNAGWNFKRAGTEDHPYRENPAYIPSLESALRAIPAKIKIILDMKALPAEKQTKAVAELLTKENAWSRVWIYSTETEYQNAFATYSQAQLFESRDATRTRLAKVALGEGCENTPPNNTWTGFELQRDVTVTEKFTLGEGISALKARMWTPASVSCFRQQENVQIVIFGINTAEDYASAACLGANAVLSDSPEEMTKIRANLQQQPISCQK